MIVIVDLTCDFARSAIGTAMCNVAVTYGELGRHQDALVLHEKTLEFWRLALPENHPKIGAS